MRYRLRTLIDITETNVRRNDNSKEFRQQQNFQLIMQTIGLRVNLLKYSPPRVDKRMLGQTFGDNYSGRHCIWTFEFEVEYPDALSMEMLVNDFDHIPVITDLDETVQIQKSLLYTSDSTHRNIIFEKNV